MPKDFETCEKNKGRMRTISGPNKRFGLAAGQYIHVCFDAKGMHRGEMKEKVAENKQLTNGKT